MVKTAPKEHSKMKAILLTTYFCIFLRGTLSEIPLRRGDTDVDSVILPGYTQYGGKYYKVYTELKTWEEARKVCHADNADLVVINSSGEASFVKNLVQNANPSKYPGAWVGFRDQGERQWKTITSKSLTETGYNTWYPWSRKPIGGCGTIKTCGRYDARDCQQRSVFVCQY